MVPRAIICSFIYAFLPASSFAQTPSSAYGALAETSVFSYTSQGTEYGHDRTVYGDYAASWSSWTGHAEASAQADLEHGLLRVSSATDGIPFEGENGSHYTDGNLAFASAALWDVLTFYPKPDVSVEPFSMDFVLDGSAGGYASARMDVWIDGYQVFGGVSKSGLSYTYTPKNNSFALAVQVSALAQSYGYDDVDNAPAFADYWNTMHVRWNLPSGWTYKSASGVFRPDAQAVPEPATLAVLGLGLLCLKRRKPSIG